MSCRFLIAGIGNIFFGDDGFGVEVVRRLAKIPLPENVSVMDFGIRGFDLALALTAGYDKIILVDAMPRGKPPGTVFLIEPEVSELEKPGSPPMMQTHGLHPVLVLQLARTMGDLCPWIRIVGCEPATLGTEEDPIMGLSEPVQAGVAAAIAMIRSLVEEYCHSPSQQPVI